MIHVIFPAGGFGSTIEYCLRQYTQEYYDSSLDNHTVDSRDGSVHGFTLFHPVCKKELKKIHIVDKKITTPIYGNRDQSPQEVLDTINNLIDINDNVIFVKLNNFDESIFVWLINLYKCQKVTTKANHCDEIISANFFHYSDNKNELEFWQKREILALNFAENSLYNLKGIKSSWISVSTTDLSTNIYNKIIYIIEKLNLTLINEPKLIDFCEVLYNENKKYFEKYKNVIHYSDSILNLANYSCSDLTLFEEAMIQARLWYNGYEICCYGLNKFPENSKDLMTFVKKR